MNHPPIRNGFALLVVIALTGCAVPVDQRQAAARMCDHGETLTCEEFAGNDRNCFCADRAALRQIFDTHKDVLRLSVTSEFQMPAIPHQGSGEPP